MRSQRHRLVFSSATTCLMILTALSGLTRAESNTTYSAVLADTASPGEGTTPPSREEFSYRHPYSLSLFNPRYAADGGRVASQTASIGLYGLGVVAVLFALPESSTGWERDFDFLGNWVDNVSTAPEWDRNNWAYNYIGHAYFGGVYYQVARKSGFRQWDAFAYTLLMSTLYWEYGIEAFAEVPSVQDLVFTPVIGWVYGEWAYQTERAIRKNGNELWGSRLLGGVSLFLLDPVDSLARGVNAVTGRELVKSDCGFISYSVEPTPDEVEHQVLLHLRFPLGASGDKDGGRRRRRPPDSYGDPVDTGIVGVSAGTCLTMLDNAWNVEDGFCTRLSVGLYFTPRVSARLAYAWGDLQSRDTSEEFRYETYSLDGQWYFNPRGRLRPFVSIGLGEQIWERDDDQSTYQCNGGVGLQWSAHRKWSVRAGWRNHYSPAEGSNDQSIHASVLYRFGDGEK